MKAGGNCIPSKPDYIFFEVAICLYLCSPLVRVPLLFKYALGSIVTWLLMILYSMVTLFFGSSLTQRLSI